MVAQTISLPNIHRFFIPDPGYIIADCDLAGAEAQVVAWEAEDEDLKAAFRAGQNVHIKNARDIYPDRVRGWSDEAIKATNDPGGLYYTCKRCVHATHNGGKPRGLALAIPGLTIRDAEEFQRNWWGLHPRIAARQEYVMSCLQGRIEGNPPRTIFNKFGYRMVYFDRIDSLLPQALTWVQQSTVAIISTLGAIKLDAEVPWCQILLQVHDSLVIQYPLAKASRISEIQAALTITVPYDDPLDIPWGLKTSSKSWGDVKAEEWTP